MTRRAQHTRRDGSRPRDGRRIPTPRDLLERAGLRPHHQVVDIGCGSTGTFTVPAVRMVGDGGVVTAVDVDSDAVAELGARKVPGSLRVEPCGPAEFPLHDGDCDFGILGYTLHEVRNAGKFLAEVNRVLKVDGRLMVVDWRKVNDGCQPPKKLRLARGDAEAILERAGFEVEEAAFLDDSSYIVVAVKERNVETVNLYGER